MQICAKKSIFSTFSFPVTLTFDRLTFASVTLVQRYVSTKLGGSAAPVFLLRENRRHGTDRRTGRNNFNVLCELWCFSACAANYQVVLSEIMSCSMVVFLAVCLKQKAC